MLLRQLVEGLRDAIDLGHGAPFVAHIVLELVVVDELAVVQLVSIIVVLFDHAIGDLEHLVRITVLHGRLQLAVARLQLVPALNTLRPFLVELWPVHVATGRHEQRSSRASLLKVRCHPGLLHELRRDITRANSLLEQARIAIGGRLVTRNNRETRGVYPRRLMRLRHHHGYVGGTALRLRHRHRRQQAFGGIADHCEVGGADFSTSRLHG